MIGPAERFRSLPVKFSAVLVAVVAGVGFTIGASVIVQDWFHFRHALEEKALLLARSVAVTAVEPILGNDYWALYKRLDQTSSNAVDGTRDSRILTGMVLDPDGVVLAHLQPAVHPLGIVLSPGDEVEGRLFRSVLDVTTPTVVRGGGIGAGGFVEGVAPIYSDEKRIGLVRLRMSTAELSAQAWKGALTVTGITFALVAAGSVLGVVISQRMTRPLSALAGGMDELARGNLSAIPEIEVRRDDEIGYLAQSFNRMAGELQEKRRLERELAVSEKMIALGRISAGVAHEVNNPLAGMLNLLDTLKKRPDDWDMTLRYLSLIEKGLHRIRLIVSGLLGELRLEDAQDLADPSCLQDLYYLAVANFEGRKIHLAWNNELPPDIRLNCRRVHQVVSNLIDNAAQALPGEGGTVTFTARLMGAWVFLSVEDDGPGIPEEVRDRLFEPFYSTRANGTGLGLWISYRLVKSMGGDIEVAPVPGHGARFTVSLPARYVQNDRRVGLAG